MRQVTVVWRTQAVSPIMRLSAVNCMDTCRPSTSSWSRSTHVGAFSSPLNTVSFFLNVPSPESEITLAMLVVLFQGQGSRIFGSRVRYVALPCRLHCCLSDDILDPSLPPRRRGLAPNTVYLRTQLCSLTCHIFHAYFRGYASFIWTPTTPSYHPMRHPCTVVVVVTVILFFPTGVRQVSFFTCTMCWIPLWALRACSGTMASLQKLYCLKSGGPFVVQLGGDGCGSLLLVFGGCYVVMCVCFVCGSRFAMRAVCELRLPREVASLPRTQQRYRDDVCVPFGCTSFYFPFAFSLLRSVRRSAHRNQQLYYYCCCCCCCSHVYAENDDDCVACVETELLCGSKDSRVYWRSVGESSWTACRTDKKPDTQDLTEEEAFNAIFDYFAARSCSDCDGTNNFVGMEEYLTPDLTTPNTTDVCSDGTASMVLGRPPPLPRSRQTAVRAAAPHRAHIL
ncbi:hypothetical protein ECC02_007648 [Trypanosoma cruzi]|uniref:Uncharacterized protein n=1 Tax=Trypanosoma cruzi TaxID=5693 RepID=A0A7J6XZV5_TRYCR|nr:hypothetical protein ECC02_007648 [Trypanosoma cruzi]